MTDPAPLTLLTEDELDELADRVGKGPDEPLYDRCGEETTGRAEMHRLIESARLALTLQRRVEEAEAIRSLVEWAARGIDKDREFTVRYLGGIEHPWCVRVEDDRLSWSHEVETCTLLPVAVRVVLREAAKEGFE